MGKKKFILEKDEYGDVSKYILNENIYIERVVANNFTRTTSKYYLISNGKIIKESGLGTGYSLKDLKDLALTLV